MPYFRIFNPISQSRRFDPDGRFLRRWLPELEHLDEREIHNPPGLGGLFGVDGYPAPLVDLSFSRERALAAFRTLPQLLA
ncbi:Deoxyribodipyrimidine photo-lyase [compost metagenome]